MDKWAHEELGIPLSEAASFFVRIRTPRIDTEKTAEVIKAAARPKMQTVDRIMDMVAQPGHPSFRANKDALVRNLLSGPKAAAAFGLGGAGLGAATGLAYKDDMQEYAAKHPEERIAQFAAEHPALYGGTAGGIGGLGGWALGGALSKHGTADRSDDELKEEGRKRGVTNLAAEATREKGRRGARVGKAAGSIAGGVGGAALGRKYLGGPAGTIAGLAAGMVAGGRVGEEIGTEHDSRKNSPKFTPISKLSNLRINPGDQVNPDFPPEVRAAAQKMLDEHKAKIASMRMQKALIKMADDGSMMAPAGEQDQGAMAPPPPQQELAPQNYLQAELMGQKAQEAQEQQFYRDQLKSSQQQADQLNQQVQQMQQQLQQVQQQADQAQQQIQQSTQQAVQAQDQATQQAQEAANARISAQRMRAQILDLVSKDPSMFSLEQGQPGPGQEQPVDANGQPIPPEAMPPDAGNGQPPPEGPAAAAPAPQTVPGAAPPAGAPDMNASAGPPPGPNPAGAEGTTEMKTSADWAFYRALAEGMKKVGSDHPFHGLVSGKHTIHSGGEPGDVHVGDYIHSPEHGALRVTQHMIGNYDEAKHAPRKGEAKTFAFHVDTEKKAGVASRRPFDGALTGNGEGKTASVMDHLPLIGAGLGAAGGAASSLMAGRNVEGLHQKVQELEGAQDGGFRKAMALAAARKALASGQLAQEHPYASAGAGALGGALTGMMLPSIVQSGQGIVSKLKDRFGS